MAQKASPVASWALRPVRWWCRNAPGLPLMIGPKAGPTPCHPPAKVPPSLFRKRHRRALVFLHRRFVAYRNHIRSIQFTTSGEHLVQHLDRQLLAPRRAQHTHKGGSLSQPLAAVCGNYYACCCAWKLHLDIFIHLPRKSSALVCSCVRLLAHTRGGLRDNLAAEQRPNDS